MSCSLRYVALVGAAGLLLGLGACRKRKPSPAERQSNRRVAPRRVAPRLMTARPVARARPRAVAPRPVPPRPAPPPPRSYAFDEIEGRYLHHGQVVWLGDTPVTRYKADVLYTWRRTREKGRLDRDVVALYIAPLWARWFAKSLAVHRGTVRTLVWAARPNWYAKPKMLAKVVKGIQKTDTGSLVYAQEIRGKPADDPRLAALAAVAPRFVGMALTLPAGQRVPAAQLAAFKKLRTLAVRGGVLHGADLRALQQLPLQALELHNVQVVGLDAAALVSFSRLQRLVWRGSAIPPAVVQKLSRLSTLVHLDLQGASVGDRALAALATAKQLRYLDLRSTRLTDAGLSALAKLSALEVLRLDRTPLTDASVGALGKLVGLRALTLTGTRIQAAAFTQLSSLRKLQDLRPSLLLAGESLATLRQRFPKLRSLNAVPDDRSHHALAYDAHRGRTVLYGGNGSCGIFCPDTWEWDGVVWHRRRPALGPGARSMAAMAYDSRRKVVVMFGGDGPRRASSGGVYTLTADSWARYGDTWEWDGRTWTERKLTPQPSARSGHAMVYDSHRGRVVLFGGAGKAETWEYDGKAWTQMKPATSPPPRRKPSMTYDSRRRVVVLFGGAKDIKGLRDTWEYDGKTWTQRKSRRRPPMEWHGSMPMAYHAASGRTVLLTFFIKSKRDGTYPDNVHSLRTQTWTWDGKTWRHEKGGPQPYIRFLSPMVYDSKRKRLVLFGGQHPTATRYSDTWEYDGKRWHKRR